MARRGNEGGIGKKHGETLPLASDARVNICFIFKKLLYDPSVFPILAKLQNTGPLIYISLNHKGPYCVMLRS